MTKDIDIEALGVAADASQRAAAERFVAGFAAGWGPLDAERLRDQMHPDTRNLIPPMNSPADREGVVAHFKQVQAQLPGLRLDVERWAATGDAVFIEWRATVQLGSRTLQWRGIDRVRLRGDKTYEGEAFWDTRRLAEMMAEIRAGA